MISAAILLLWAVFTVHAQQIPIAYTRPASDPLRVPGESPAYYCSDPSSDIFQITRLDFIPTNPTIGYYLTARLVGYFSSSTGDVPWLNITGSINGRQELEPVYNSPLCDIDVFQEMSLPIPGGNDTTPLGMHRSCPPSIQEGYAVVSSPPVPLHPQMVPVGRYELRAEAKTQNGRRIFCVEGSFDVTT
ncbi:hypothetical protein F4677DRAFT_445994 [Hypoxylon crocopeplum]|nr:hypothetical protein F4677DRAFT_445994 [Hypoxylon crocopeplum]